MVKEIISKSRKYYECEECKLIYEDRKLAEKCEAWCNKHHSCNLAITKYHLKGGIENA